MGIMRFNYRSQVLGHYIDISVVLPTDELTYLGPDDNKEGFHPLFTKPKPQYKPGMKFQTVYVMHGGGDDDSLVFRYTNAELYAQRNCVMLVVPNVVHSFGARCCYGKDYSKFITEELPRVIQSIFPSSPKREDNFIVGYAMGGNAALGNAIISPQTYAACVDISGGIGYTLQTQTMIDELKGDHFSKSMPLYCTTFGPAETFAGSPNDIRAIAEEHIKNGVELPFLTLVCGSKEFIRKRVEGDVAALEELNIPHKYIVAEGYDHNFEMWDKYMAVALDELFPLIRKPVYPDD